MAAGEITIKTCGKTDLHDEHFWWERFHGTVWNQKLKCPGVGGSLPWNSDAPYDERTNAERERDVLQERLDLAKQALIATGYFTPDQVGDDIAPRITEMWASCQPLDC